MQTGRGAQKVTTSGAPCLEGLTVQLGATERGPAFMLTVGQTFRCITSPNDLYSPSRLA